MDWFIDGTMMFASKWGVSIGIVFWFHIFLSVIFKGVVIFPLKWKAFKWYLMVIVFTFGLGMFNGAITPKFEVVDETADQKQIETELQYRETEQEPILELAPKYEIPPEPVLDW